MNDKKASAPSTQHPTGKKDLFLKIYYLICLRWNVLDCIQSSIIVTRRSITGARVIPP
jgi:hypothetical protein